MSIIKLLSIIAFSLCFINSYSQSDNEPTLIVGARSYNNKILLRYFPTSPFLFTAANRNGYIVERAIQNKSLANENLNYSALKSSPIKPWSEKKWEEELKNRNPVDSNEIKLAAFAMALGMQTEVKKNVDVLENDLKSLKEKQAESQNKFAFVLFSTSGSLLAAEGLGMLAIDDNVSLGTIYVYRVRINNNAQPKPEDWVYLTVECKAFNPLYLKGKTEVKINEGDKTIDFSFPQSIEYYAFSVERSKDGGKTFDKLSDKPEIKLKPSGYDEKSDNGYLDSNLVNYKKYQYRIYGSTIFADQLLLAEFEAMPRDRTPPPSPFLKSAKQTKPKEVEVIWEMPNEKMFDLKGFIISRSKSDAGGYISITKTMLSSSTRKFSDNGFDNESENYYKVQAVDTAGNMSYSFPIHAILIDSTPPSVPVISSAIIDSLGKITITIKPNTEKDFMGYQLLKANAADHEFSVIKETYNDSSEEKVFVLYDSTTLNTLSKKIYYQAIAFDTHFNQSEPSIIIELKRRDTIPPVSPVITDFFISDTSIQINFVNSSSEDVIANLLLRRQVGKVKFDTIFINRNNQTNSFKDIDFLSGVQYEYAMIAKDDGILYSKISNTVILKSKINNRLPTPIVIPNYDRNKEEVALQFILSDKLNNQKITVEIFYKTPQNDNWLKLKSVLHEKGKPFTYKPEKGLKELSYSITITDSNNRRSNFSEAVKLIL